MHHPVIEAATAPDPAAGGPALVNNCIVWLLPALSRQITVWGMRDNALYTQTSGIRSPWKVSGDGPAVEDGEVGVFVYPGHTGRPEIKDHPRGIISAAAPKACNGGGGSINSRIRVHSRGVISRKGLPAGCYPRHPART